MRLNHFISQNTKLSRRRADEAITQGKVKVNYRPAQIGEKINPAKDTVILDNQPISIVKTSHTYLILNKPTDTVSTHHDTHDRPIVTDLIPDNLKPKKQQLLIVGRLDQDSEGLILLTTDGQLAYRLTHPSFNIPKTYLVTVKGQVRSGKVNQMKVGVKVDDDSILRAKAIIIKNSTHQTTLKVILNQGKKRHIRRLCAALHLHVLKLLRTSIGPINLDNLKTGESRPLTQQEIDSLYQLTQLSNSPPL